MANELVTLSPGGENQIEHVPRWLAVLRQERQLHFVRDCPRTQVLAVLLPDSASALLDLLPLFELSKEKSSYDVRGQEARAQVDPGILVDFAAREFRPVGS